jgi:hypothetical protein
MLSDASLVKIVVSFLLEILWKEFGIAVDVVIPQTLVQLRFLMLISYFFRN